jgi:hypothetical protein
MFPPNINRRTSRVGRAKRVPPLSKKLGVRIFWLLAPDFWVVPVLVGLASLFPPYIGRLQAATDVHFDAECVRLGRMPKYIIERDIPGAGNLTGEELRGISQTSCGVLNKLGPSIQWVESYVTADKVYCVYIAPNEELVREHARQGGFPVNKISEVKSVIDPTTAE